MTGTSEEAGRQGSTWLRRARGERPWLLAHRGGHGPWRENTLEAFKGGLSMGADGVELDVRVTKDDVLVVNHDPGIDGVGLIDELRHEQLPPWVPTLEQALAACAGAILNVEIKTPPNGDGREATERLAEKVVEALRPVVAGRRAVDESEEEPFRGPSHVLVSSFSTLALKAARAALGAPPLHLALGLLVVPGIDPFAALGEAARLGCVALNPFCDEVTENLVLNAHDSGMAVVTWTVNDADRLEAVAEAGVDAVVSDEVGLVRAVLGARPESGGLVRDRDPRGQSKP
jgi:glycerophosphoryl diester phosphodiesterase